MIGRVILYLGVVLIGMLLLIQRPVPMAIAPSDSAGDGSQVRGPVGLKPGLDGRVTSTGTSAFRI